MTSSPRTVATDVMTIVLTILLVGYLVLTPASVELALALSALVLLGWVVFRCVLVSSRPC
jgi:uncharacterized membrane protein